MTHKEFCLWLEGFFARGGEAPTAEQWSMVGKRLQQTGIRNKLLVLNCAEQ